MSSTRCGNCGQFSSEGHICPDMLSGDSTVGNKWTETRRGATLDIRTNEIATLEDLLERAEVNLDNWAVERHTVNSWGVSAKGPDDTIISKTMYAVKVWLRPLRHMKDIEIVLREQVNDMESYSPVYMPVDYDVLGEEDEPHMLEVCIMDPHFGMYAWGEETGDDNYTTDIAKERFVHAATQLIQKSKGFNIEKIVFPLGNDGFHSDGPVQGSGSGGATTRGTVQDVDTRHRRVFRIMRKAAVEVVDSVLLPVAPVHIPIVTGNHDERTSFFLGDSLESWYRNSEDVSIDNSPRSRKYVRYGNTLLGYTHGDKEKIANLPLIMATEMPLEWSETETREWHLGHEHRFKGDEVSGVRIRWMPSISPITAWMASRGYRAQKAAEAYLWERNTGFSGSLSVNAKEVV